MYPLFNFKPLIQTVYWIVSLGEFVMWFEDLHNLSILIFVVIWNSCPRDEAIKDWFGAYVFLQMIELLS